MFGNHWPLLHRQINGNGRLSKLIENAKKRLEKNVLCHSSVARLLWKENFSPWWCSFKDWHCFLDLSSSVFLLFSKRNCLFRWLLYVACMSNSLKSIEQNDDSQSKASDDEPLDPRIQVNFFDWIIDELFFLNRMYLDRVGTCQCCNKWNQQFRDATECKTNDLINEITSNEDSKQKFFFLECSKNLSTQLQ